MLENMIGKSTAIDRAMAAEELTFDDGMELMNYDNIHMLGATAEIIRKKLVGNDVTFTASYYMNYTNVCAASCQMCAFYRKGDEDDAYTLTPEQIEQRVSSAEQLGATEVHIVGGFHPDLPLDYYEEMMKVIKEKHPNLTIKPYKASEIFYLYKLPFLLVVPFFDKKIKIVLEKIFYNEKNFESVLFLYKNFLSFD